jgi:hypothetical protein
LLGVDRLRRKFNHKEPKEEGKRAGLSRMVDNQVREFTVCWQFPRKPEFSDLYVVKIPGPPLSPPPQRRLAFAASLFVFFVVK